jgi:hypothetical protein
MQLKQKKVASLMAILAVIELYGREGTVRRKPGVKESIKEQLSVHL